MAGCRRGDRSAPANGVVVRIDFRCGLGVFPVGLDEGFGLGSYGAASPIRRGEELGLQALAQPECCARDRHAKAFSERGALRVEDGRGLELIQHAVERRDGMERRADVVAEDRRQRVGCWSDDGDLLGSFQGQRAIVLEQDDAFFGGFARGLAIGVGGDRREGDAIERAGRIEDAELEARGVEALGGLGYKVFRDKPLAHGIGQRVEAGCPHTAGEVGARLQRENRGVLDIGRLLVTLVHIDDGAAVGDDKALEAPCIAEMLFQQHLVGAGRPLIDGVVGAHHGLHVAFGDGGAEGRQVGLFEIARAGIDIEAVAQLLGAAVHREVLTGGDGAQMLEVVALHSADEGDAEAAGEERVFAVGFLAAAPARIAEDVDVGRPEGESIEDAVIAFALGLVVFGAGFRGNDVAHAADHSRIPGGGHADGLRKDSCISGACHAVKGFVPCLVVGNAEAGNGGCPVFELRRFFIQRHAADQVVGTFLRREICVEVGRFLCGGACGKYGEVTSEMKSQRRSGMGRSSIGLARAARANRFLAANSGRSCWHKQCNRVILDKKSSAEKMY